MKKRKTVAQKLAISALKKILSRLPPDDDQIIEEYLVQILTAIQNEDAASIVNMFSPNALSQIGDIYEQIRQLFFFSEFQIDSRECLGGNVSESVNYGIVEKTYRYRFYLYSKARRYIAQLEGCLCDDIDPSNEGLHFIGFYQEGQTLKDVPRPGIMVQVSN